MDLKFSFGGASPDHSHGEAPLGIPLPFSTSATSTSSVLEILVRRDEAELTAEAVSGDGVTYGRSTIAFSNDEKDSAALAEKVQSAISRVVAELDGPLAEAVTAIKLALGDNSHGVLSTLGFPTVDAATDSASAATGVTTDAFQRRTGVASGTSVHVQ